MDSGDCSLPSSSPPSLQNSPNTDNYIPTNHREIHNHQHCNLNSLQIETYRRDGVLVVPNVLTPSELNAARAGLRHTLLHQHGVDTDDLRHTGHNLRKLSSTNGSGGVLDIFYPRFKMDIATNVKLYHITSQLWENAYCHMGETEEEMIKRDDYHMWHPFGQFDCDKGYIYIDRIGYRLPSKLAEEIGKEIYICEKGDANIGHDHHQEQNISKPQATKTKTFIDSESNTYGQNKSHLKNGFGEVNKESILQIGEAKEKPRNGPESRTKKRSRRKDRKQQPKPQPQIHKGGKKTKNKKQYSIQRSLTPHLDCCPETIYTSPETKVMWRPIQCFVSLTDNIDPSTGGFEAAPGFHRTFHEWAQDRPKTLHSTVSNQSSLCDANGNTSETGYHNGEKKFHQIPPPCIGEYTHIRPREDRDIMDRITHIPVSAGDAVFWDNRLPHANSYRNDGNVPRAVVYCSFLPDVAVNRKYMERQLEDWRLGRIPRSMWINVDGDEKVEERVDVDTYVFSELGRKLIGIDKW